MANTSSAKKKVRVIERKTISREMYRNKIKTYIKKVESLITEKDQKSAMELLKKVDPKLQASKNKKILFNNFLSFVIFLFHLLRVYLIF